MSDDPLLSSARNPEDSDAALRPKTLAKFVGQAAALEPYGLAAALTASMELP